MEFVVSGTEAGIAQISPRLIAIGRQSKRDTHGSDTINDSPIQMKFSIAAIGLTYACAAQATIQILHRHVSHDAEEEYSVRGTVGQLDANGTARLQAGPAESVATRDNWEIYQLLAASDDVPASEWPMTSIPAVSCPLRSLLTRPIDGLYTVPNEKDKAERDFAGQNFSDYRSRWSSSLDWLHDFRSFESL